MIKENDSKKIKELVEKGGDVTHQEETDGTSALMLVAAHGNVEMIEFLLSEGAVWNAVDRKHKCAGDYATDAGHQVRCLISLAVINYSLESDRCNSTACSCV